MLINVKKNIISAVVASIVGFTAVNVNAAVNGPYVGGQLGYGNVHQGGIGDRVDSIDGVAISNSGRTTGVAGRVYIGYQVMQNFAAELGYSKFSNANSKSSVHVEDADAVAKGSIKTDAFDLVGKGIIPLPMGFDVYGKAGIAYMTGKGTASYTQQVAGETVFSVKGSETQHHIYPTFGAGVGYDVTKNIVTDVSWNRIQKTGSSSDLESTDLFAVGVAYNFC
jgi:opacity protein-like surface antigen